MPLTKTRLTVASGLVLVSAFAAAGFWMGMFDRASADKDEGDGTAVTRAVFEDGPAGPGRVVEAGNVSDAQAAALADGYVTRGEYESAVNAAFECIKDSGREVKRAPYWDATGTRLEYEFWAGPSDGADQDCQDEHSLLVDISWTVQNQPSDAQLGAAIVALRECLVARGVPAEGLESDRIEVLGEAAAASGHSLVFTNCGQEVTEEFGIPSWGF